MVELYIPGKRIELVLTSEIGERRQEIQSGVLLELFRAAHKEDKKDMAKLIPEFLENSPAQIILGCLDLSRNGTPYRPRAIGGLVSKKRNTELGGFQKIDYFWINPDYRRLGIGTATLQEFERVSRNCRFEASVRDVNYGDWLIKRGFVCAGESPREDRSFVATYSK